jgi:pyrimidine-nucleoside phosphorylase
MSRKIASGAKVCWMSSRQRGIYEDRREARKLAELMVAIAKRVDRRAVALISDMNQPLGCAVGNALELIEAIETLQGGGPEDFLEHCLVVAGHLLVLGGIVEDEGQGRILAERAIQDGSAWERFRRLVISQGGDVNVIDKPSLLPQARLIDTEPAERSGYIAGIDACIVGETVNTLGGGRIRKEDKIDYSVGVIIYRNVGDFIDKGQPLFRIHANNEKRLEEARIRLKEAHQWSDTPVDRLPLFYDVIKS